MDLQRFVFERDRSFGDLHQSSTRADGSQGWWRKSNSGRGKRRLSLSRLRQRGKRREGVTTDRGRKGRRKRSCKERGTCGSVSAHTWHDRIGKSGDKRLAPVDQLDVPSVLDRYIASRNRMIVISSSGIGHRESAGARRDSESEIYVHLQWGLDNALEPSIISDSRMGRVPCFPISGWKW